MIKKERKLKKAWQDNYKIYKTNKIEVICSPNYEKGDDIGVFWKDHKETKVTFNTITPYSLKQRIITCIISRLEDFKK